MEVQEATEYFEATKATSDDPRDIFVRAVHVGKKTPVFGANPLSQAVPVHPSMLEDDRRGTIHARTTDPIIFKDMCDKAKSISNKKVGSLLDNYNTLVSHIGETRMKHVEILFRPTEAVSEEAKWVFYSMESKTTNDALPIGDWTKHYVMFCGCYGEKMIQGAPTTFAVYTKN